MPDLGQVRTAAFYVMREFGLTGSTNNAIHDRMVKVGVRPGSDRDLAPMVRVWKAEQKLVTKLPPHIVEMTQRFAKAVWEIALATLAELELQRGGLEPEPRRPRRQREASRGPARLVVLQRAVERILRTAKAPMAGNEIFLKLTDMQARLTDERHFFRDLLNIEKRSKQVYRLPGCHGKWWRQDRALPSGDGADRPLLKTYVRRGTELSNTRTANEEILDNVVAELIKNDGRSVAEMANALAIPADRRARFRQMMRNHPRAKNQRFRSVDGKYYIVKMRNKKKRQARP
jgi:hypothetical protein